MNIDACAKHCRKHISRLFYFGGYTRVRSSEMKWDKINAKSKKSVCFTLISSILFHARCASAFQLTYTVSFFQETNHQPCTPGPTKTNVGFSRSRCARLSNSSTPQCRINANRGPWQLFALAPLLTRDKDISQPATRVDTTYWQLFRPDINTAHFYFLLQKLCQISWLLTSWKIFSTSGGPLRPEARGICHI